MKRRAQLIKCMIFMTLPLLFILSPSLYKKLDRLIRPLGSF